MRTSWTSWPGRSRLWTEFNGFYYDWATVAADVVEVLSAIGKWIALTVTASVGPISKPVLPAVGKWQAVAPGIFRSGVTVGVLPALARWIALPVAAVTGFTVQVLPAVAKWTAQVVGVSEPPPPSTAGRPARSRWRGRRRSFFFA